MSKESRSRQFDNVARFVSHSCHAEHQHSPAPRHTPVEDLAEGGETIELRERNTVLGKIVPEQPVAKPVEWPDFEARAREIFGDRVIPPWRR